MRNCDQTGFNFRGESLVLDAKARSAAPGEFVELPDGITHYELAGPEDGQVVVLVHGFSTPCFIWDPTFNPLAEAGFRVLRFDLFGRGYSDRPDTVYDLDLFNRQLLDLLSALNIPSPVDLVGLSMGARFRLDLPLYVAAWTDDRRGRRLRPGRKAGAKSLFGLGLPGPNRAVRDQ